MLSQDTAEVASSCICLSNRIYSHYAAAECTAIGQYRRELTRTNGYAASSMPLKHRCLAQVVDYSTPEGGGVTSTAAQCRVREASGGIQLGTLPDIASLLL